MIAQTQPVLLQFRPGMHTSGGDLSEVKSTIAQTQPMVAQVAATIAQTQPTMLQFRSGMHASGGDLSEVEPTIAQTQPMVAQVAATIVQTQSALLQFRPANANIRWWSVKS
jgi:ABC-type transporter Mla subunit MlaD